MNRSTLARLTLPMLATCWMSGCIVQLDGSLDVGDSNDEVGDSSSSDTSDGSATEPTGASDDTTENSSDSGGDDFGCAQAIDVLFVIDNSGSMGGRQRQVADAAASLVNQLDLAGMDWRIAVTTTDNGNPWCTAGTTTPEFGRLVASSCRERLGDFLFSDTVDVQAEACTEVCNTEKVELASTVIDGVVRPGTWVERSAGMANTYERQGQDLVPLDPIEALRCMLPQGVNGCGFEAPLDSMQLALERTADPNEDQFGFLRDDAQLVVIIISDEVDCSYNPNWADIFAPEGNKAFWSDPSSSFPTSAVCWNAGVVCSGEGPNYADCVPADKDIDGNLVSAEAAEGDAVLNPLSQYSSLLSSLEAAKQAVNPAATVKVFGLLGLGLDGELHYADSDDPSYQDSFGIGPGCSGPGAGEGAIPPVRMRELVGEFDGSLHSVCKSQYIDAFKTIGNRVTADCAQ